MPKETKKPTGKKVANGGKKNKLYSMPEKIPEGTILADNQKRRWKVGPSIGLGGFGEIYSACIDGESKYEYVVKCEPSENGPLFVEMHFYKRNGKETDLKTYQKNRGLKSLGMPHIISSGSLTLNGIEHRYIVMPRYGKDLEYYFLANGRRLPIPTVYRLAIQMLDVLEYVHQCGYVHADLKASNILLGLGGKNANTQAYLVDFGLAARYHTDRDYKPDPKKAHNGTIEYTSRDAHKGVLTMRADLEILGYNLIQWLGAELPWVRDKLLAVPTKVQAAKVQFMAHIDIELHKIFPQGVPGPLNEYMKYVAKLEHNDRPDYKKCRKIFQDALKALKVSDSGDLQLTMQATPAVSDKRGARRKPIVTTTINCDEDDEDERNASDDDDDDVVFETKPKKATPKAGTLKPINVRNSPTSRKRISPRTATSAAASPSPSPSRKKTKSSPPCTSRQAAAKANIKFSPAITLAQKTSSSLASSSRHGSTLVNNNVTPNPRAKKTYEFNVEVNVSMDADVIVNVNRKKKAARDECAPSPKSSKTKSSSGLANDETPTTRVKVHKVNSSGTDGSSGPNTPVVMLKKKRK